MGVRFRKSLRVGKYFRINISKSGIGYSFGVKGARLTKKSSGGTRSTLSIPGTGVSYVHDSKSRKNRRTKTGYSKPAVISEPNVQYDDELNMNFNSCELQHVVNKIKLAFILPKIFLISAIIIAVLTLIFNSTLHIAVKIALYAIAIISAIVSKILSSTYNVRIDYDISADCFYETTRLQNKIRKLCKNSGIWIIESFDTLYSKRKGTYASLNRTKAALYENSVAPIKTNADCLTIKTKKQTCMFLPDMLIVFSGVKFSVISYNDIRFQCGRKEIEELYPGTPDVKVVGTTWQQVTKSGDRDRRYSENKQVAICEYGLMCMATDKGFELNILSANSDNID